MQGNGVLIVDGATTPLPTNGTDLGSAAVGATLSVTYTVRNTGTAALSLGTPSLPAGFSIDATETLATIIAAGASDTFKVIVDTTTAGTKSGQISIANNDADENPYNFNITATVTGAAPTLVELDNTAATLAGSWTASTSKAGYVGSNYQHDGNTSKGTKSATYTPTLIAGRYAISVNVPTGMTVTNVPVDIYSNNVLLATMVWNQTSAGTAGKWSTLGTFDLAATGTRVVVRTTGTSGFVAIDAVRFTPEAPAAAPEIDVQGNGVLIIDGSTTPSTTNGTDLGSTAVGATLRVTYTVRNTGTAALSLGTPSLPAGFSIDPTDTLAASLAAGASDTFKVLVDTSAAGTKSGQISIGNNDTDENPFNFNITATVTGGAPTPTLVEMDNTQATFTGTWTAGTSKDGYLGTNYQHDGNASKGTKTATYTPTLVAGKYAVAVNAPTGFTATNVPVDIYSNNVLLATILWSQTLVGWSTLGATFDFSATGTVW